MAKLLLERCQIIKKFGQKFWRKKLYNMPKNWLRRMCGVLRTDFLKVNRYHRIFVDKSKKLVIYLSLGCWMQKFLCEYFVPFSNGSCKTSGGTFNKSYLIHSQNKFYFYQEIKEYINEFIVSKFRFQS
jgi:hypothetical protein